MLMIDYIKLKINNFSNSNILDFGCGDEDYYLRLNQKKK